MAWIFTWVRFDCWFPTLFLTNKPTYSTEWSPLREVSGSSASQEIRCVLRKPNVHYRVYNNPTLVPNPESAEYNTRRPILFYLRFNIILSSKSRSYKCFFPSGFLYVCLSGPIRAKCSILLILNNAITLTISGEAYISWSCPLCGFLHPSLTSS